MCVSPLSVKNPNFAVKRLEGLKDISSQMLRIPCGYCAECIALKQMYLVQRVQMETSLNHVFFATLTYRNEMLPKVSVSSGYDIAYADSFHIEMLVRKMRNSGLFPGLRHLAVSEFGGQKGRPHFHCLFFIPKDNLSNFGECLNMERRLHDFVFENWSVNIGSKKIPRYEPLCEYHQKWINHKLYKNYDLHYVNPSLTESGVNDVAWYVLKYMLKSSPREVRLQQALRLNLPQDEYEYIWQLVRPKLMKPHWFGLCPDIYERAMYPSWYVSDYIRQCIDKSPRVQGYPLYYVPDSGLSFPLAKFYRDKSFLYPAKLAYDFYYNSNGELPELKSGYQNLETIKRFESILGVTEDSGSDSYFSNL